MIDWKKLSPHLTLEVRYLGRGVVGVMGAGLMIGGWWHSPWSPHALQAPAELAAAGDPEGAVEAYTALAEGWATRSTRTEAIWRASEVAAVELDAPNRALELLQTYLSLEPSPAEAARAWERLGGLYAQRLGDPARAAEAWETAAGLEPESPRAARWLLDAGLARVELGDTEAADRDLRAATADASLATDAWLALGRLDLGADPATAYESYDRALQSAGRDEATASLARLGMATALERLDGPDAALAVVDNAINEGDGDAALERRRSRLMQRR